MVPGIMCLSCTRIILRLSNLLQNIQKDDQMNLLRDANLQLRTQVFDLNQDIVDLLEIVESQKNRRMVSHKDIANLNKKKMRELP